MKTLVCIFKFAILWPIQVYAVLLLPVQWMEQMVSVEVKKWLGVPQSVNRNALLAKDLNVSILMKSLVKEQKAGKTRSSIILKESND